MLTNDLLIFQAAFEYVKDSASKSKGKGVIKHGHILVPSSEVKKLK